VSIVHQGQFNRDVKFPGRKKEEALLEKLNTWAKRRRSTVRKMEYLGQKEEGAL
jgi:hypothetical protein